MKHIAKADPITRDLRAYRAIGIASAVAMVVVLVSGGLALKQDRKNSPPKPLGPRGCYQWSDGVTICKPDKVAP